MCNVHCEENSRIFGCDFLPALWNECNLIILTMSRILAEQNVWLCLYYLIYIQIKH